jgi:hypothetical protein
VNTEFLTGVIKAFDKSSLSEEGLHKSILEVIKLLEEGEILARNEFTSHIEEIKGSKF